MKILAIDPSGNFNEGKGTTGFAKFENGNLVELYERKAKHYSTPEEYWHSILYEMNGTFIDEVVFEGYRLYHHRGMSAQTQANSELETIQLIGAMKHHCWWYNIPYTVQYAKDVKGRWSDKVLVHLGILEEGLTFNGQRTNAHKRDAARHGLHYIRYGRK